MRFVCLNTGKQAQTESADLFHIFCVYFRGNLVEYSFSNFKYETKVVVDTKQEHVLQAQIPCAPASYKRADF